MTTDTSTADGDRIAPSADHPSEPTTPPQAAPKPTVRRRRGLALAGIIAAGLLALALAFGGGMALGWGLGAVTTGSVSDQSPGRDGHGFRDGGPGGPDGRVPPERDSGQDETESGS